MKRNTHIAGLLRKAKTSRAPYWFLAGMALVFSSFRSGTASQDDWVSAGEKSGVKLSYKLGECNGQHTIYLRAENPTGTRFCLSVSGRISEADGSKQESVSAVNLCVNAGKVNEQICSPNVPGAHVQRAVYQGIYENPRVSLDFNISQ